MMMNGVMNRKLSLTHYHYHIELFQPKFPPKMKKKRTLLEKKNHGVHTQVLIIKFRPTFPTDSVNKITSEAERVEGLLGTAINNNKEKRKKMADQIGNGVSR